MPDTDPTPAVEYLVPPTEESPALEPTPAAPETPTVPQAPIIVIVSLDQTTGQANITAGARGAVPMFYQATEGDVAQIVQTAIASAKSTAPTFIVKPKEESEDDDDLPITPKAAPVKKAAPAKPSKPTKPPKGQGVPVSLFDIPQPATEPSTAE